MKRILLALGSLAALAATAVAQVPPPIPALPDSERRIAYSISGTTCACSLGFSLWEDGVDVDQQISVWINGVQYLSTDVAHGWGLTSATGPLASIPRPITDAVLTFTLVQTGTIQIVGAARPRRLSQFTTTPTVRDFNQVLTYLTAAERERWDLNSRQLRGLPGETLSVLPAQATRASTIFGWDSSGNPTAVAPNIGLGTVVGPAVSVNGHIAVFNGTNGQLIADGGALSTTPANPTGIVGCTPVNGVAATIMRSDGAPGLNLAASCTYTGNSTLNPTSGNALTINPLGASLGQGFVITQTPAGVLASDTAVNTIAVTTSATGAGKLLAGLQSTISTTSTSANGADTGVFGAAALIQATTNAYQGIGVTGTCVSAVSSGGSGTGAGTSKGACFGFNSNSQLQNGAVNFNNLVSYEADVAAATGSSVYYKGGITAALGSNDAVRGAVFDCGLCISSNSTTGTWKNPILIGNMNSQIPVAADTTLFTTAGLGAITVTGGINLTGVAFSGNAFSSTGFSVDGLGQIQAANLLVVAGQFIGFNTRTTLFSPADGVLQATNFAANGFTRLILGTNDANGVAIKKNATAINFVLGNDTGDAAITAATGTHTRNSIGTTSTDGLIITNTTAAGAGAQQFSPRLRLTGQGWRTNAGGASETVDWMIENRPVQSTADPLTTLVMSVQQNGTGYSPHTAFVFGGAAGAPSAPADATQRFISVANSQGSALYGVDSSGSVYAWCNSCTGGTLFGTAGAFPTDFWTNNVRRVRIASTSTHVSFWNNTSGSQLNNTPPALTACGTTPAINAIASDTSGTVTMGTAAPAGCVITFNVPYVNVPICRVTWRINIASMQYAVSATAITLTQTATSSNVVDYICDGS